MQEDHPNAYRFFTIKNFYCLMNGFEEQNRIRSEIKSLEVFEMQKLLAAILMGSIMVTGSAGTVAASKGWRQDVDANRNVRCEQCYECFADEDETVICGNCRAERDCVPNCGEGQRGHHHRQGCRR